MLRSTAGRAVAAVGGVVWCAGATGADIPGSFDGDALLDGTTVTAPDGAGDRAPSTGDGGRGVGPATAQPTNAALNATTAAAGRTRGDHRRNRLMTVSRALSTMVTVSPIAPATAYRE